MSEDSSVKYCQNNKKNTKNVLKVFLRTKNNEKQQYGRERYQNLLKDEKQKLAE